MLQEKLENQEPEDLMENKVNQELEELKDLMESQEEVA